jgi:hypothetical protein
MKSGTQDVFCSTKPSWQGGRCAPPVASPKLWLFQGIEPVSEPIDRIASQTLAGDFALPAPIDQGAIAPPEPTRRPWRNASPPAPNHAQPAACLITNQGSVPATPNTPKTTSWRRLHRDQGRELSRCRFPRPIPSTASF